MDSSFSVPERWVVSEIIDGEAILLDLRSGSYYSSRGLGALIWQAVLDGANSKQVIEWAQQSYPTVSRVTDDLEAFLGELLGCGLIESSGVDNSENLVLSLSRLPYQRPELEKYDDMKDLFMLDPIHDVDEVGWPVRKASAVDISNVEPHTS